MDDNKQQNQYQDILNQYDDQANQKPKKTDDQPKTEEPKSLKDINSLQIEAPDPILEIPSSPEPQPEPQPEPLTDLKENLPPITPPQSTPNIDEVKSQVNEILNYPTRADSSDEQISSIEPNSSNLPKILFFISLFIFIGIIGALAYFLTSGSKSTDTTQTTPTASPTKTTTACYVNGLSLGIGESFKAADGCNTCSCTEPDVIACTEMACEVTPTSTATKSAVKTTITPTKSATTSSIPKDWKTYTDKTRGVTFRYPNIPINIMPDDVNKDFKPQNYPQKNEPFIKISYTDLSYLTSEFEINRKSKIEKGQLPDNTNSVLSEKIIKLDNNKYVLTSTVLSAMEQCDVRLTKSAIFYTSKYMVETIYGYDYYNDRSLIPSKYLTTNDTCGQKYPIWIDKKTVSSELDNGIFSDKNIQTWFNTFDQMVKTISF